VLKHFERAINVAVFGEHVEPKELRKIAELIKNEMKALGVVSRAEIVSAPPMEIAVRIPRETLQAKNLTIESVAATIRSYDIELSAGVIRTAYNNILIKGEGRKTSVEELGRIPIRFPNGEFLTLKELAGPGGIADGFIEDPIIVEYSAHPAVIIQVEKGENEDLIDLCDRVKAYIQKRELPYGLRMEAFRDLSQLVKDRLSLILKNGAAGLVLVLLTLALFLEWRIAFWVATGIAFSLIGSLALLYAIGGTINMMTLFGFLMTTGIVVDDAIVVGENFFNHKLEGMAGEEAAERSMAEVGAPVLAMVSTTLTAFVPLLFVEGLMGDFVRMIPQVVLCALTLSLFEALFILPSHLAHHSSKAPSGLLSLISILFYPLIYLSRHLQPGINDALE
ncbi:MAG: efflux RND transporter permease subunit, partial [Chlamydiia bacterium]|nr:efflux RND transporter permease subunit [Chlamydiia bacterium]